MKYIKYSEKILEVIWGFAGKSVKIVLFFLTENFSDFWDRYIKNIHILVLFLKN